jgi:hypothetical protein
VAQEHVADPLDGGATLGCAKIYITDKDLIRDLYDHPSAEAYGEGSYTVCLA